jgi:hypothetical protein
MRTVLAGFLTLYVPVTALTIAAITVLPLWSAAVVGLIVFFGVTASWLRADANSGVVVSLISDPDTDRYEGDEITVSAAAVQLRVRVMVAGGSREDVVRRTLLVERWWSTAMAGVERITRLWLHCRRPVAGAWRFCNVVCEAGFYAGRR